MSFFVDKNSLVSSLFMLARIKFCKAFFACLNDSLAEGSIKLNEENDRFFLSFFATNVKSNRTYYFVNGHSAALNLSENESKNLVVVFFSLSNKRQEKAKFKVLSKIPTAILVFVDSKAKDCNLSAFNKDGKVGYQTFPLIDSKSFFSFAKTYFKFPFTTNQDMYFYKYLASFGQNLQASHSYSTIKNGDFFFCFPKSEDDPFEIDIKTFDDILYEAVDFSLWASRQKCFLVSIPKAFDFVREESGFLKDQLSNKQNDSNGKIEKLYNDYRNFGFPREPPFDTFGIFSASNTNKNIVLWSQYGESHKGICVKYSLSSVSQDIAADPNISMLIYGNVVYSSKRPLSTLKLADVYLFIDKNLLFLFSKIEVLFTKFSDWNYQKEFRIVAIFNQTYTYKTGYLSTASPISYYVGCRNDDDCSVFPKPGYAGKMKESKKGFALIAPDEYLSKLNKS